MAKNNKRTKKELTVFLRSALALYDGALYMYGDKRRAKKFVVDGYDDLQEWLYEGQN